MTDRAQEPSWAQGAVDAAGGLDLLLTDAALGMMQLLGGQVTFVLSTSGHIAAMVNPPGNPKAAFQTAPDNPADPREFLAAAQTVPGSWWPDYSSWLAGRSGGQKKSPGRLGRKGYPMRGAAPGTYVHDH